MKKLILISMLFLGAISNYAQESFEAFFTQTDQFLKTYVSNDGVDYAAIRQKPEELQRLRDRIGNLSLEGLDGPARKAFLINAYNLLVIAQVVEHYPLKSVSGVSGFFDAKRFTVAGERLTLDQLEKQHLLKTYDDARLHFVLVCGAIDCPPIIPQAYLPRRLEAQLERQTSQALNDPEFIRVADNQIALSQIFEWYRKDFGGKEASIRSFINRYRENPLPSDHQITYYNYDWSLNERSSGRPLLDQPAGPDGNNDYRYVVSATAPRGEFEFKSFSNLYNQVTGKEGRLSDQATFFTFNYSALFGFTNRFNAGIDLRYRQVSFGSEDRSRFDVFSLEQSASNRHGLTGVGPKIRYAPFKALPNFSIQSTYWFATSDDLAGAADRPFIDFNGDIWFTQIFNDFSIGNNFSLFTELDLLWEDIGNSEAGHINRFSSPVQLIFSFFPTERATLYTLGAYSPFWQEDFDYFYQAGLGAKYQITPKLELEFLYTHFRNTFILDANGQASTLNFGIRISTF